MPSERYCLGILGGLPYFVLFVFLGQKISFTQFGKRQSTLSRQQLHCTRLDPFPEYGAYCPDNSRRLGPFPEDGAHCPDNSTRLDPFPEDGAHCSDNSSIAQGCFIFLKTEHTVRTTAQGWALFLKTEHTAQTTAPQHKAGPFSCRRSTLPRQQLYSTRLFHFPEDRAHCPDNSSIAQGWTLFL